MSWACGACGFQNQAGNSICGGFGTAGCKLPKEMAVLAGGTGGYGKAGSRSAAGKEEMEAEAMAVLSSLAAGLGPSGSEPRSSPYTKVSREELLADSTSWACKMCNFINKGTNELCGGFGSKGCKTPRSVSTGQVSEQGEPWTCICGFINKPVNTQCGGPTGNLGCNIPKETVLMMGGGKTPGARPAATEKSDAVPWLCPVCGFKNQEGNEMCGGSGPIGCKLPRWGAEPDIAPFVATMANILGLGSIGLAKKGLADASGTMIGGGMLNAKGGGKGKDKEPLTWQCMCGFKNKESNQVCGGGGGSMGCKMPRSEGSVGAVTKSGDDGGPKWLCACGFWNISKNDKCGGNGPMGCKKPKPI
eukprot:TRINITY_DN74_c0_g1_i1.p1 TRINITY_DN74_c0_g1~~TRINITY_DN74_c0_g1_i1.p1  ORF type:complete len:360 (+),score=60.11 TRINITY_DN74_c0_g1_i1:133-1212(+)